MERDEERSTERMRGPKTTWRETLEHGSSYQSKATHVGTVSPALDLDKEQKRKRCLS